MTTRKHAEAQNHHDPLSTFVSCQKASSFQSYALNTGPEELLRHPQAEFARSAEPNHYDNNDNSRWCQYDSLPGNQGSNSHFFDVVEHTRLYDQGVGRRSLDLFGLRGSQDSHHGNPRCILTRVSSGDESIDDGFIQMISRQHTLTPDESQGYQLIAALNATEPTPQKGCGSSIRSHDESQRKSGPSEQSNSHTDTKNDNFRSFRVDSKDSGFSLSSGSHQDFNVDDDIQDQRTSNISEDQKYALEQKDIAFQKLIKRLNGSGPQDKKSVELSRDSGYEHDSIRQDSQAELPQAALTTEKSQPTHETRRRVHTASDFAVGYWPRSGSQREDHSTDSGNGEAIGKSNTLNPKAREFLSFSQSGARKQGKARRPALPSFDISNEEQVGGDSSRESPSPEAQHKVPVVPVSQFGPTSGTLPVSTLNTPSIPLLFQPFPDSTTAILGLIPLVQDAYKPVTGQTGTWPSCFPGSSISDYGKVPVADTYEPRSVQNPLFHGFSAISSSTKMGVPNPSGASTMNPATNSLPRRVPKPKQPNPRDQQEYEAWVEWRKATEPGYAMACKLRQQRRAQRNGSKVKQAP